MNFNGGFTDIFKEVVLPFLSHWERTQCRLVNGWFSTLMDTYGFPTFTMDGRDIDIEYVEQRIRARRGTIAANTSKLSCSNYFQMDLSHFTHVLWRGTWLANTLIQDLTLPESLWLPCMATLPLRALRLHYNSGERDLACQARLHSVSRVAPKLQRLHVTHVLEDELYANLICTGSFTALTKLTFDAIASDDNMDGHTLSGFYLPPKVNTSFLKALPNLTHLCLGNMNECAIYTLPTLPTVTHLTLQSSYAIALDAFFALCHLPALHTLSVPSNMIGLSLVPYWLTHTLYCQRGHHHVCKHKQMVHLLPHVKRLTITHCAAHLSLDYFLTIVAESTALQRIRLKNVHPHWYAHTYKKATLPTNITWQVQCTPKGLVGWYPRNQS